MLFLDVFLKSSASCFDDRLLEGASNIPRWQFEAFLGIHSVSNYFGYHLDPILCEIYPK